jgi:hypothetical protein
MGQISMAFHIISIPNLKIQKGTLYNHIYYAKKTKSALIFLEDSKPSWKYPIKISTLVIKFQITFSQCIQTIQNKKEQSFSRLLEKYNN